MSTTDAINTFKKILRVVLDACAIGLSLTIAYKLRLEYNLSSQTVNWFWSTQLPIVIGFVIGIRLILLFAFQIYSRLWRYTEVNEILELIKPIAISSFIIAIPRIIGLSSREVVYAIPIGIIIMDSALCLIFLAGLRILRKWQVQSRTIRKRAKILSSRSQPKKRTILIGAGIAAQELARKVALHPELQLNIIGALDDDKRKLNTKLANGIKVMGPINMLEKVVKETNANQILIAIPSLPPQTLREIIELCHATKLETNIVPGVDQLAEGKVTVEQIRKVSLEDLLGREPVDLFIPEVSSFINNKTVLITGAGGSIGSELTRQLVKHFTPKMIYILGRGENSIFQLTQELSTSTNKNLNFKPIICDIRNYDYLYEHFVKSAPDVVFHTAAHKHVPLMEDHPAEAFTNNVIGTKNAADIAGKLNVKTFVNISTDKAVNPINVLGCTKRLAELVVAACSKTYPNTKYVSVRFGNVIGSRGSVVPVWEYQLKNKVPITVTAKDAYRFFMTITEAASLVIKAGAVGKTSEIMVLDMGNEVNIYELAKDYIKLSGFSLDEVKISLIGLRPGEKLKEELVGYYEGTNNTKYSKILVIEPKNLPASLIESSCSKLLKASTTESESFKSKLIETTKELNKEESKLTFSAL